MKRKWQVCTCIVTVLTVCFLAAAPLGAQVVNASLVGSVTDPSGAAIPEASVTATNTETDIATKTTTDTAGNYTIPSLPPGVYNVTFEKSGFNSKILNNIKLEVDTRVPLDAQLEVGNVTQRVEVVAAVPIVTTTTATVGTVIDTQKVVELPLNLREYGSLATLVPGTFTDNGGFASSTFGSPFSQTSYNSNGNRSSSNSFLIDGVESRNLTFGGFALQPPPDAVQEFNLETNIYSAAFGLAAGSAINLTTKSGTNQIHGAVYDFLRNDKLDARNFFALNQTDPVTGAQIPASARPEFRRNQFGFVVGGPIKKDKTFFFGNYEGLRRVEGGIALNTVPTPTELGGNLSGALTGNMLNLCGAGGPANLNYDTGQLFYPNTVANYTCPSGANAGKSVLVGTPIPGNQITTINGVAAHALSLNPFPSPNYPGAANFAQTAPTTQSDNSFIVKIDHNFSDKDQIFGRYMFGESNWVNPYSGYTSLPGFGDALYFRGQNVALGWTHSISSNILNEARLGFQRNYDINNCASCPRSPDFMSSFGVQNLKGYSADSIGFPIFGFNNFSSIGDSNYRPVTSPDMVETYADTVHWTRGTHTLVFGADMQFWQVFGEQAAFSPHGELDFRNNYSSLNSETTPAINSTGVADLADFLLGYPGGANETLRYQDTNQAGGKFWSYFVQDDWKARPNLSLNFGLRWEYRGWPVDKRDSFASFEPIGPAFSGPGNGLLLSALPAAQNDALCSNPEFSFLISSTGKCLVATSAQRASFGLSGRNANTLIKPYYGYFDPRFGLAWRPLNSDKLVVRGGFGVFTDLPNFNNQHFVNNNPITGTSILFSAPGGPPVQVGGAPVISENVFSAGGTPPLSSQFISLYVAPNYKDPTVEEWSFGVQSQLSPNVALEVDYVGNHGYHEGALHLPGNQPVPTPPGESQQANRPYPDFGTFLYTSPDAFSKYDSLQVKLTKRFANGFTLLGSYTWQQGFDDNEGDEGFGGGIGNGNAQNDNCLSCNYGPSYGNAHDRFVLSGVWQLPVGKGEKYLDQGGVVGAILGGWRASGIFSYQSGFPFTVQSNTDWSNSLSGNPLPDRICNGNNGPQTVHEWFNTNCFTDTFLQSAFNAGTPRFGNEQRNDLIGPPFNNLDFALLKDFALSERFKLQFRAESYNALNHASFGYPGTSTGIVPSSTLGVITYTTNSNREIQFALKLLF